MEVEVHGLRELREALTKKIPAEMQGKVLQAALVDAAKPVVEAAKSYAPTDTGILRASIHSERVRSESNGVKETRAVRVRSRRAGRRIREREAKRGKAYTDRNRGSGARYWWYQEFGTRYFPAKRFMTKGWEASKRQALEELIRGLKRAMVEAVKKARWNTPTLAGSVSEGLRRGS